MMINGMQKYNDDNSVTDGSVADLNPNNSNVDVMILRMVTWAMAVVKLNGEDKIK